MITVDATYGAKVGLSYMSLPALDDAALPSFDRFARETAEQYHYLTQTLGLRVDVTPDDPYPSASAMFADVDRNARLRVWDTAATGSHPYLSDDTNNMFRAVHDYFGHYANRYTFTRHGEESAYRAHRVMYGTVARAAMATETRGQNSAFIFYFDGKTFPPQRVALLPSWAQALY